MGWKQTIVVALLVLSVIAPSVVAGNERPLADAGLDQTVERGATVLLDATGSRDPDGELVAYRWRIEAPNGTTLRPECPSCNRTRFRADQPGRYEVTVTVSDDDGRAANDTLYVTVGDEPDAVGPSVELVGDEAPAVGAQSSYTARFAPGDAPIASLTWSEDGSTVAEREPSGRSDRLRTSFDSPDPRTIRVRVTDEAGRTARATLDVDPRTDDQSPPAPDTPPTRTSPTIDGPRLLTGEGPFQGTYTIRGLGPDVAAVDWVATGTLAGTGTSRTVEWQPGRQEIYAEVAYASGAVRRATFPDGNTTVIVDPAPDIQLTGDAAGGTVSGNATATDAYGNLRTVVVGSNGTVLSEASGGGSRQVERFSVSTDRVGDVVKAVATDARGQQAVATYRPGGTPELVSARFVNDPVDSYHPRINESRYAGEHVVRVDLNGADPDSVDINVKKIRPDEGISLDRSSAGRAVLSDSDTLVYRSYWASKNASDIRIKASVFTNDGFLAEVEDTLDVSPSPPEVRVRVVNDGRTTGSGERNFDNRLDWGITVDASRSFDPDGSNLQFVWNGEAEEFGKEGMLGKFTSRGRGSLEVIDSQDQITVWRYRFHGSFNPGVKEVTELSEGPYYPNETVRLRAITPFFETTKDKYEVTVNAAVDGQGTITGTERVSYRETMRNYDSDYVGYERYEWTIAVPAKALMANTSTPTLMTRNPKRPRETEKFRTLPNVEVEGKIGKLQNLKVTDLRYLVERQQYERVTAQTTDTVEMYKNRGYEVESIDGSGIIYDIEERAKVRDAVFETREQSFGSPHLRRMFIQSNQDWSASGKQRKTVTETFTETEWRDRRGGPGQFTGNTRRVKVDPARYQTEHRYVTTSTTTETVTRERQRCLFNHCWTVEVEDTVTRTERDYYWSTAGGGFGGTPTGDTRRRLIDPAEYETQYQYEVTRQRQRTETRYMAEREVKVTSAKYEWQHFETTHDKAYAKALTDLSDSYRISRTESTKEWTLRRASGSDREWVSSLEERDSVLKTSGTILSEQPIVKDGEVVDTKTVKEEVTAGGKLSADQLIEQFKSSREPIILVSGRNR